jgi:hypothetical protein
VSSVPDRKTETFDPEEEALTRALEILARNDASPSTAFDWDDEPTTEAIERPKRTPEPASSPLPESIPAVTSRRFAFGKARALVLIALLGAVVVGVSVFAWSSSNGLSAQSTVPASSAPVQGATMEQNLIPTSAPSPAATHADDRSSKLGPAGAQPARQKAEQVVSATPEILQALHSLEHRLASLEQDIEQIKASRVKLTAEQADLANTLRQDEEKLSALIGDLAGKFMTEAENAARERSALAEQLQASREQIDRLKAVGPAQQRGVRSATPQSQTSATPTSPPTPRPASVQARVGTPRSLTPSRPAR